MVGGHQKKRGVKKGTVKTNGIGGGNRKAIHECTAQKKSQGNMGGSHPRSCAKEHARRKRSLQKEAKMDCAFRVRPLLRTCEKNGKLQSRYETWGGNQGLVRDESGGQGLEVPVVTAGSAPKECEDEETCQWGKTWHQRNQERLDDGGLIRTRDLVSRKRFIDDSKRRINSMVTTAAHEV